jgi:hypothetical protein
MSFIVVLLLVAACSSADSTNSTLSTSTSQSEEPSTTLRQSTTLGDPTTTSTQQAAPVELLRKENQIVGVRSGETVFVVTHDPTSTVPGDDHVMVREPDGLLSELGRHGSVWYFEEVELVGEDTPGVWQPWEIHRLWPVQPNIDVAWLTDYSGTSGDSQPPYGKYVPETADYFTLFDQIVLESDHLNMFGFHIDCHYDGQHGPDELAAAVLSFEGAVAKVLVGWRIDYESGRFVELEDPSMVSVGHCLTPESRH